MLVCPHRPKTWRTPRRSRYPTSCSATVGWAAVMTAILRLCSDRTRGRNAARVGAAVRVVHRVDPSHRAHRLSFLVGVGEDPGKPGGDEQGVAERARKAHLVEDRGHGSVDVDGNSACRRNDRAMTRAPPRRPGGRRRHRLHGRAAKRRSSRGSAALCWRWPKPGIRSPRRRRLATSSSAASAREPRLEVRDASTTAAMVCMAESTAAPWYSPRVSSPAAAAACSVAPPEIAVRAARTDGAPAPWSMLATMTASISRAVWGSGSSPVYSKWTTDAIRNRPDQFADVVAPDGDRLSAWFPTARCSTLTGLGTNRLCSTSLTSLG